MLFNSYVFILLFLPVCILGYYGLNYFKKYTLGQVFLLGMSLWFYAYFNISYLLIIAGSIAMNYFIYFLFQKIRDGNIRKTIFVLGLVGDIGLLLYFKYMDFFIRNINIIFHREYELWGILLPLGISFFTFQQLSFLVDAYRKEVPQYGFLYYATYVAFFPQLIAGPIVTHDELIPQFLENERKHIDWDYMAKGIYIFVLGLAKKVLLADTFGKAVNWGYANIGELNSTDALVIMLAYTIQIYFDFSGYCDMAIGIGKMLHIDLPVNFNSPYKALTITEFWDRWHITLTRFFTKYVYIPLGGNRKGMIRTYLNILLVFVVSGFWHGASWSFVFWGMCHGLFVIANRHFKKFFEKLHPALNWIITFGFVNVMWVFFRAGSFKVALAFLNKIAVCDFGIMKEEILECFRLYEIIFFLYHTPIESMYPCFIANVFFLFSMAAVLGCRNAYEKMQIFKPTVLRVFASAFLLVWCVCSFTGVSTFLYFNF